MDDLRLEVVWPDDVGSAIDWYSPAPAPQPSKTKKVAQGSHGFPAAEIARGAPKEFAKKKAKPERPDVKELDADTASASKKKTKELKDEKSLTRRSEKVKGEVIPPSLRPGKGAGHQNEEQQEGPEPTPAQQTKKLKGKPSVTEVNEPSQHRLEKLQKKEKKHQQQGATVVQSGKSVHDQTEQANHKSKAVHETQQKKQEQQSTRQQSQPKRKEAHETHLDQEAEPAQFIKKRKLSQQLQPDAAKQKPPPEPSKQEKKQPKLLAKMKEQLMGGRFRWLNEKLYTCRGEEAFSLFQDNPSLFDEYHSGFQAQAKDWPLNPQDVFIHYLNSRPASLVVADFGCGEAKIAASVKQKVHSFDLVARNDLVTACDMANVPLKPTSVDIAIFSLSLMGTNASDFVKEAHRVLKPKGELKVAEVVSRIQNIEQLSKEICMLGFKLVSVDESSKFFVFMDFVKQASAKPPAKEVSLSLKPCLYKKR